MVRPAQSPESVPALRLPVDSSLPECDCFYLGFGRQLRRFCGKKIIKNLFFNATVKRSGNIAATL
jgi:hypothetical protein